MNDTAVLEKLFRAGIEAVDPYRQVAKCLSLSADLLTVHGRRYDLRALKSIYVAGFGKASVKMARAVSGVLGGRVRRSVVLAPVGKEIVIDGVRVLPADHPVCGPRTIRSSRILLDMLTAAERKSLTILLVSGGGSAMFEKLPGEIPLGDYQDCVGLLLRSGADIRETNKIRTGLSLVKGGGLLSWVRSSRLHSLIVSDVLHDDLKVIASGPTCRTSVAPREIGTILDRYGLRGKLPGRITEYLDASHARKRAPGPRVVNSIIASNAMALKAIAEKAGEEGYRPLILDPFLEGEARDAGKFLAGIVRSVLKRGKPVRPPCCIICGGETTVTVRGKGRGGRNQEISLSFLRETEGIKKVAFLSAGTDGVDGFTDAAGAFVTDPIRQRVKLRRIDPGRYLENNDSNGFFRRVGGLLTTGPTGTNVMDVQIILVGRP